MAGGVVFVGLDAFVVLDVSQLVCLLQQKKAVLKEAVADIDENTCLIVLMVVVLGLLRGDFAVADLCKFDFKTLEDAQEYHGQ